MFSTAIQIKPAELLAAWRIDTGRLVLPAHAAPALRQKAAIRVEVAGTSVSVTVRGTVVGVHRSGPDHVLELAPEAESKGAIQLLLAAARGERIRFLERSPRWLARLPVVVEADGGGSMFMATTTVSEGGCGIAWTGPRPSVGQGLALRIGAGTRRTDVRGVVCWMAGNGPRPVAGVRFLGGDARAAWGGLVAEVARAGAPRA